MRNNKKIKYVTYAHYTLNHQNLRQSLLNTNKTLYFVFLCFCTWLLLFFKKSFIEYETTAFLVLEQEGKLGLFDALTTLQYISVPLIYLYKFTIISFLLWMGSFMFGYRILFNKIFGAVIIAETIFLLPELIKIIYLLSSNEDANFFEIRAFYPLSLMNFFDPYELHNKFHYPAKSLNLFEFVYWVILVKFIHWLSGKRLDISIYIVSCFYILFYLLWLVFFVNVYK